MKKLIIPILATLSLLIVFSACNKGESYADKLKKEKKNIKAFVDENNIKFIDEYPEGGKFKENEFFYDKAAGIYINVVDTGNGHRVIDGTGSEVHVRYAKARFLPETEEFNNNGGQPISFIYGNPVTYQSIVPGTSSYLFLSPSLVAPLKYVGEGGIVKLIIPFNQGSYYQKQVYYGPIYMGHVKYQSIQ